MSKWILIAKLNEEIKNFVEEKIMFKNLYEASYLQKIN